MESTSGDQQRPRPIAPAPSVPPDPVHESTKVIEKASRPHSVSSTDRFRHFLQEPKGIEYAERCIALIQKRRELPCHVEQTTYTGRLPCLNPSCPARFNDRTAWTQHIEQLVPSELWVCYLCEVVVDRRYLLAQHLAQSHSNDDLENQRRCFAQESFPVPFRGECGWCDNFTTNDWESFFDEHVYQHLVHRSDQSPVRKKDWQTPYPPPLPISGFQNISDGCVPHFDGDIHQRKDLTRYLSDDDKGPNGSRTTTPPPLTQKREAPDLLFSKLRTYPSEDDDDILSDRQRYSYETDNSWDLIINSDVSKLGGSGPEKSPHPKPEHESSLRNSTIHELEMLQHKLRLSINLVEDMEIIRFVRDVEVRDLADERLLDALHAGLKVLERETQIVLGMPEVDLQPFLKTLAVKIQKVQEASRMEPSFEGIEHRPLPAERLQGVVSQIARSIIQSCDTHRLSSYQRSKLERRELADTFASWEDDIDRVLATLGDTARTSTSSNDLILEGIFKCLSYLAKHSKYAAETLGKDRLVSSLGSLLVYLTYKLKVQAQLLMTHQMARSLRSSGFTVTVHRRSDGTISLSVFNPTTISSEASNPQGDYNGGSEAIPSEASNPQGDYNGRSEAISSKASNPQGD